MEMIWRWGGRIWTACSAGWFCLWLVTDLPEAAAVSFGCACMAGCCSWLLYTRP